MRSIRNPRTLATALAAAFVALALTAPAASAWTPSNQGMVITGTLTLKRAGIDARTCSVAPSEGEWGSFSGSSSFYVMGRYTSGYFVLKCTNGQELEWYSFHGEGFLKEGKQMMRISGQSSGWKDANPWGEETWYTPATIQTNLAWNNATAVTASNVVFSENKIGETASFKSVTASGTLYFKTMFGGKLTLP